MSYKKQIVLGIAAMTALALFSGCYKNHTVIPDTANEITRAISFKADVVPIFNSSCNMSGCHNAGGKTPDLTSTGAYLSLTAGDFVNKTDPLNSLLYLWMTGKKGTPMPLSGPNKEYNAIILAWIKQGALNN